MYIFLSRGFIHNPKEYDQMDPETKHGLMRMLEFETKKQDRDEARSRAQQTLANAKVR